MIIRRLSEDDYELFLPLIQDFRNTHFSKEQYATTLSEIHKSSTIWVVEYEGKLVATATIQYESKFIYNLAVLAHVEDVCVLSKYRKQGFGKLIVQHCVQDARQRGAYKITLDCAANNVPFYQACGFEVRGTQMTILLKEPQ